MSGVVYDHIPVTPEDPTNGWVKLYNNMYNQGNGIFRHYELPVGVKKTYDLKVKLFKNFFPALKEEHATLLKEKRSVPESYAIGRTTYESYLRMVESQIKIVEDKTKKMN